MNPHRSSPQHSKLITGVLLSLEITCSLSAIIVFSCIFARDYRKQAWRNGGFEGWNSDPHQRVYSYINHEEVSQIPTIWSNEYVEHDKIEYSAFSDANRHSHSRLSRSTLAVSVVSFLSTAICNLCTRLGYMNQPALFLYYVLLNLLWLHTLSQQLSGDFTDNEHLSPYPWYLTRSCTDAWPQSRGPCHALRAGVYVFLLMLIFGAARSATIACGVLREWALNGREWQDLRKGTTLEQVEYHMAELGDTDTDSGRDSENVLSWSSARFLL